MDDQIEAFKALSVAAVSDAMDRLGLHGACFGILPLGPGCRSVGRAFTVKYIPVGVEKGTVGDYIDNVAPGEVVVLDNAGRLDCTVWGDLLTSVAHKRGVAGTVVHGVCRDVARSFEIAYPIFSRGRFMRTGKDRVQVDGVNVPVSLGDVQVCPGDILLGNDDGIVVVPKQREGDVLSLAQRVSEAEEKILSEALRRMRLEDARRKYGYHELQRRGSG